MRHNLSSCTSIDTIKILKSQLSSVLIPLLSNSDSDSNEFTVSIAALIAEAAKCFGVDIFSSDQSIDQIILNLLTPSNPSNFVLAALNLVQDLLLANFALNPEIILCFPPLIEVDIDITFLILQVCDLFSQRGCYEAVKKVILQPLLENVESLPKNAFIELINVSSTVLEQQSIENEGENLTADPFNAQLIQFTMSCMNDPDQSKSEPAMACFQDLQDKLGFIPESVILLYNNLTMDDGLEADENETVKGCMLTLRSIAENHPEECLEFIIPQIKQDLSENDPSGSSTAMKRGLRGLAAISKFLPDSDIEDICLSIIELLNTPMRKEAISTLEKIALAHQNFYPQSLNSIFPFICYNEEDEAENSSLRMQAQRSLDNMMTEFRDEIEIPCAQYINYVYQMLQISYKPDMPDELNSSLIFIDSFFKSVDSLIIDENESESSSIVKEIIEFAIQSFLSERKAEDDSLYFYSFNVISSAIEKLSTSFLSMCNDPPPSFSLYPVNFACEVVSRIHLKCLYLISNESDESEEKKEDDRFYSEIISMYSSLFSFLSCKLDDISAYRDGILEMVQPILPTLAEFLSTLSTELSNISWHFASDILRSTESNLFQEFLLKNAVDAVGSIFGLDNQTNADILGNIALVFYDVFKVGLLNLESFSKDDFEVFITVFSAPIEKESSIEISDVIDLQNISLLVLRLGALTNLPVKKQCLIHAAEIVQSLQESNPDIYAEAQEMIAAISQNHKSEEEEDDDDE